MGTSSRIVVLAAVLLASCLPHYWEFGYGYSDGEIEVGYGVDVDHHTIEGRLGWFGSTSPQAQLARAYRPPAEDNLPHFLMVPPRAWTETVEPDPEPAPKPDPEPEPAPDKEPAPLEPFNWGEFSLIVVGGLFTVWAGAKHGTKVVEGTQEWIKNKTT